MRYCLRHSFSQIKFAVQKRSGVKAIAQPVVSAAVNERDEELEDLEQRCYAELLNCCKAMAGEAGVTYTSIMNLIVSLFLSYK